MARNENDYELYTKIEAVQGWLHKVTAHRTIDILAWQVENGIAGNLMEIGVFCGRYFSILVNSAKSANNKVLGMDTFQFAPQQRVVDELDNIFGKGINEYYELWEGYSTRIDTHRIVNAIGYPRFISVDGAHDYENVYRDLVLVEQIISPDGIIAADDFLNPLTLGVNQAINAFLSTPRAVVPVAYISNKLFLAHRSRADDYRVAIEAMILEADDPQSANFREQIKHGRHHVEQDYWGHKVLIS